MSSISWNNNFNFSVAKIYFFVKFTIMEFLKLYYMNFDIIFFCFSHKSVI